jgi:hypothetical protein
VNRRFSSEQIGLLKMIGISAPGARRPGDTAGIHAQDLQLRLQKVTVGLQAQPRVGIRRGDLDQGREHLLIS